ncbi:MAG: hypothetical protein WCL11_26555, partial [Verrucomicrobiota bacterium]
TLVKTNILLVLFISTGCYGSFLKDPKLKVLPSATKLEAFLTQLLTGISASGLWLWAASQ